MLHVAVPFTDYPAWGFWGIVVALVLGLAGIWAAYHFGEGKTRIYYTFNGVRLRAMGHSQARVDIVRDGVKLSDPYLCELTLQVISRRDISAERFSKQRPLAFDLGIPALAVAETQYAPANAPAPAVRLEGSNVLIGPDLIHNDARLKVVLLTDGRPELQPPQRTIEDVAVLEGAPTRDRMLRSLREGSYVLTSLVISVLVSSFVFHMHGLASWIFAMTTGACTTAGFRGGVAMASNYAAPGFRSR
jgi:hypothetical protein